MLPDRNNSSWLGVLEKVESVFWGGGGHDWEITDQEGRGKERGELRGEMKSHGDGDKNENRRGQKRRQIKKFGDGFFEQQFLTWR